MDSLIIQKVPANFSAGNTNSKPTGSGPSIRNNKCGSGSNGGVKNRSASRGSSNGPQNLKSPYRTHGDNDGNTYQNRNSIASISNSKTNVSLNKYRRYALFPRKNTRSPTPGYRLNAEQYVSNLTTKDNGNTADATGSADPPHFGTSKSNLYQNNNLDMHGSNNGFHDASSNISSMANSSNVNTASEANLITDYAGPYSRKVFVGGLPPDISKDEIVTSFQRFGQLRVDWPHKITSKSKLPPKGYVFLIFKEENSIQQLIDACVIEEDKLYLCISSSTIKDKAVQIRPWLLADSSYMLDTTTPMDPRKMVFIGGIPRPLKAYELATIMDRLYGGVAYAGIDTDTEFEYPKGTARVVFSNKHSYIAAISGRYIHLQNGDIDKRVEVKPFVLGNQMCDECQGQLCSGRYAPFFCTTITCLKYYCEHCWTATHSHSGREYHKVFKKAGNRSRVIPFR